jgi:two-component system LytT family sensor kinase
MTMRPVNKRLYWAIAFLAFFTLMSLISATQSYVIQLTWDKPVEWSLALRRSFKEWYAYALLALVALLLARRTFTLRRWAWVTLHSLSALGFALLHVVLISWLMAGETSVQTGETLTFTTLFEKLVLHYLFVNFSMYWIAIFAHLGWVYYLRYRERELQAVELQRELAESRLAALRMELNPHFLFNTLHAVSSLIHTNPPAADKVVARLSELLRLTLDQSKPQEVPLREELEFLEKYLSIEQTRFEDRLVVIREITPEAARANVPYLILQPLVENAIRHGIEPRETAGQLKIQASVCDGQLHLVVKDNGEGLKDPGAAGRAGIGLSNVRSRLRQLYGDAARLELLNVPEGGVEARITLPYCHEE